MILSSSRAMRIASAKLAAEVFHRIVRGEEGSAHEDQLCPAYYGL